MEDNVADVFLIREALESAGIQAEIHVVTDGQKAVRFFDEADGSDAAPCPALVILDVNLPKKNGDEVLQHLRENRKCSQTLVLIVSTSDSASDRNKMSKLGCDGYFRKPSNFDDFMKLGDVVKGLLSTRPS
ncbi:MAG: response regulator [Acidobacteriota bacterium]|nr:response regulator [Acidobacteriota bacterium]